LRRYSSRKRYFELIKSMVNMKVLSIGVAVVVVVIIAAVLIINSGRPTAEQTDVYDKGMITVGLTADSPFAYTGDDGKITGFERELADQLTHRIYGDDILVEIKEVTTQDASYLLKNGDIDIAFAMLSSDVTKTKGLYLSDPYYEDPIDVLIAKNSYTDFSQFSGKKVGVMSTEISVDAIKTILTEAKIGDVTIVDCTSYPDALEEVQMGRLAGLIAPKHKLLPILPDTFELLETGHILGNAEYEAAFWTTQGKMRELFNVELQKMKDDGTLKSLQEKWKLAG